MESVDAKIVRAHEHFNALDKEIGEFLKAAKHNFVLKVNAQQTEAWIVYWVDDPYPPIRLSTLIGDCAFNMRSALDNLVCGLIRAKDPACKCVRTKFPVYSKPETWEENWRSDLKGVAADAQTVIKGLQPFNRPIGSVDIDPLRILNELSNRDKHRAANLTTGYSRNLRLVIHANDGKVHHVRVLRPLYAEDAEIIPLTIEPSTIQPSARVEAMGTSIIAFRDEGPWGERSVNEVLGACLEYIERWVIPPLRPFFA